MSSKAAWKVSFELREEDEIFQTGALLEELVAVLEHLVNRGDNPEIVVRQASERFSGSIPLFHSGERSGQPAKGDCSGDVHVVGGAGKAEGGVEGAGLLGRAGGEGSLAESLLCLVQSDLSQVQDSSRHLHTYHSLFVKMIIELKRSQFTALSSLSPRPTSQLLALELLALEKIICLSDFYNLHWCFPVYMHC